MKADLSFSPKSISFLLLIVIVLLLFSGQSTLGRNTTRIGALEKIEADYQSGQISLDQKLLYQVQSIKNNKQLPSKYSQLSLAETGETVEPTMIFVEVRTRWEELSAGTQQSISAMMTRHSTAFTYDTPGGFFKLHYDIIGSHAVPSADTNSNTIPDFIERIAAYADSSWQKHLDLGFLEPPSDGTVGGDDKYDIYFESMGYYGYAVPESNGGRPWNDFFSHIVLNNDFVGFPPNDDPEGDTLGAAKVTVAHEYHHAIQFAYDANEPAWFMELDATYAEDIVFDATNDNYNYLNSFMAAPAKSLMENSSHMYSCFIWGLYLAQKFDTSLMLAVWEGARYDALFQTLSDTLMARYGWTQDSAIAEFAAWNYITGSRDDGLHHEEGSFYPLITVGATHSVYPVSLRNSADSPAGYGSNYVRFLPGSAVGTLRIFFDGANTREWAAYLILSTSVNEHQFQKLSLNPGPWNDTVLVPDFQNYYSVTLVGINTTEFSAGAFFSYSALVSIPHGVSTALLTTDTLLYSGDDRNYAFKVSNTTAFNDVYQIMYWDDYNWINPDTISRAIAANSDTTIMVNVYATLGTPLETVSQLHFKAVSVADSTASEEQTNAVKTVLYKGDANFDGSITILDLTYFVDYFFRSGPEPMPVMAAGDFSCDGGTNIIDLTSIVDYIFRGGSKPACNPY